MDEDGIFCKRVRYQLTKTLKDLLGETICKNNKNMFKVVILQQHLIKRCFKMY